MVLRGSQFQRFGPAGCMFLTRRASFSNRATYMQKRPDAVSLQQGSRVTHGQPMRFIAATLGRLASIARECELCHGDIGEL
jgi:hypothetical protein